MKARTVVEVYFGTQGVGEGTEGGFRGRIGGVACYAAKGYNGGGHYEVSW